MLALIQSDPVIGRDIVAGFMVILAVLILALAEMITGTQALGVIVAVAAALGVYRTARYVRRDQS